MTEQKLGSSSARKGIYLLPNLFTTAGLFSGFYAVVASMKGEFEPAAIAIFVAMIFDGVDGRVARATNTQSAFGAEYDSMADMVSFGVAPALIVYNWALADMGKIGWLAAFIYAVAGALRLARFNTSIGTVDKAYFQGLASPAAAALLAGMVWLGAENQVSGHDYSVMVALITVTAGLLMVSNFSYYSFKDLDWKGKVSFVAILLLVLIFVVIATHPALVLFVVFCGYAVSGPIITVRSVKRLKMEHVVGDANEASSTEPDQGSEAAKSNDGEEKSKPE